MMMRNEYFEQELDKDFIERQIESLEAEIDFFKKRIEHNEKMIPVLKSSLEKIKETEETIIDTETQQ